MIPLIDLKAQYKTIEREIKEAIDDVLESQHFILGATVKKFEDEIAAICGVKHAIGVASGSDAILLSLTALDIKNGDEVITTPYTFFSTAGSVSRLGAKPVFADIDPQTYNINPSLIEEKITKRTKAIIPVHLFGQCAEMDPILKIAKKYNIAVIEDAAQAIGARYKNKQAGAMGPLGCFSFFPTKNLGGYGDGGMVVTDDAKLAEKIRSLRVHGSNPKYYHAMVGVSSRLDSLQAAVLLVKLKYLNQWTEKRQKNAEYYTNLLKQVKVVAPFVFPENYHIFNQYVIRVPRRDELKKFLLEKGVETEIYYPLPLHLQECYKDLGYQKRDLPESEKAAQETLALPIYAELDKSRQKEIVGMIESFLRE